MPNTFDTGLVRPRYFDRQQLKAADLQAEQTYFRERLRRHNRFLHGWGVVCGAGVSVEISKDGQQCTAVVKPGYVVTPRGEELYIPPGVALNISDGLKMCLPSAEPCAQPEDLGGQPAKAQKMVVVDLRSQAPGSGPNPRVVDGVSFQVFDYDGSAAKETQIDNWGGFTGLNCGFSVEVTLPATTALAALELATFASPADVTAFNADGSVADKASTNPDTNPPETLTLKGSTIQRLVIQAPQNETLLLRLGYQAVAATDIYLAVRPFDKLSNPTPAMPNKCMPPGGTYESSRVCEMAEFAILCELPASHQAAEPTCEDLAAMVCGQRRAPCPPEPPKPEDDFVVLAHLQVAPGGGIQALDSLHVRRLLSESLQLAYLRCLCETAPAPVADFAAEPRRGAPPLDVQFKDGSSGQIDGWLWNFGDGSSSTVQHPSHRYTGAGTYTVSLKVTGPGGSDTATKASFITATRTLSACAQKILERGVMTVGVDEGVGWPFYMPNTSEGFVPDLLGELTNRLFGISIPIEWQVLNRDQALTMLAAGEFVDLFVPGRAQSSFSSALAWANEYFIDGIRLLVKPRFWEAIGRQPGAFKALDGLAVGFLLADKQTGQGIDQLTKETGISLTTRRISEIDNPMAMLDSEDIAALAGPWSMLLRFSEDMPADYRVVGPLLSAVVDGKMVGQPLYYQLGVVPECKDLAAEVSELLAELVKAGQWLDVYKQWFPEEPPWNPEELLGVG